MDIENSWPQDAGQGSWHLIHLRMLAGSIAAWDSLYAQTFRLVSRKVPTLVDVPLTCWQTLGARNWLDRASGD